ncbi:class I SAM-dependent methyltransferase [Sporosarcina sp. FSL W7-1349]|uniref:class I SAM-dependent methyltransferase n=1 Tax=Sporosarcina sp. FSL W7-1349 TaxID=2921561 RepID=UPI0030F8C80A
MEDQIALQLVNPSDNWRERPDMDSDFSRTFRASIMGRARFIEDIVTDQVNEGVSQYVILGAGLDTFAERRPELGSRMRVFEVDRPGTQAWKRNRLMELGFDIPEWLRFVPVDFETEGSWLEKLQAAGFDRSQPAVVASAGVTQYLTKEAIADTLRQVATLSPGSLLMMTFLLPPELTEPEVRSGFEESEKGARAGGTPFISFFSPLEMLSLAREAGFSEVRHVPATELNERYFTGRPDNLRLPSGEEFLLAMT